ncbi:hypothetical protein PILCRDRAFT_11935 [Piloderma croceum F 1598]|uniref:Apurinic-apyrimidinic endonuclease 1 n=1 Tax=Piloderma croceum (strain F 1598) TaxID=765440 RepID=A0A0C3AU68_PILCF|nr:hypothetical protein PILCRDRAFT_11935 [Piloderma croceum F 1598]
MITPRSSTRLATSVRVTHDVVTRPTKRLKVTAAAERTTEDLAVANSPAKTTRKLTGRTKEEPRPEEFRTRISSPWKVGVHVSAAGGVENAIQNAAELGANSFALFLKSQRKWSSPPLKKKSISAFKSRMNAFGYSPSEVLPHGSYLINLGNPDQEKRRKSYDCFLEDLQRCEQLGLVLYNFHPGSTVGLTTRDASIALIADCLNRAHKATNSVVTVIENMAGTGNIIGSAFADLADIIRRVEDKSRVGVCLDTCHMFAAGYDVSTMEGWESTSEFFAVGLSYLRGMHLNDSKHRWDLDEIATKTLACLPAFRRILSDHRLQNIPIVIETPSFESTEIWTSEVEVLNQLSSMGDTDEDRAAVAAIETKIKGVVRRVSASANAAAKSGKKTISKSTVKHGAK